MECIQVSICIYVSCASLGPSVVLVRDFVLIRAAVRDTLGTGIYFATYESSKQILTTVSGKDAHKNPIAVLVAGALCGIVSWALICECQYMSAWVVLDSC